MIASPAAAQGVPDSCSVDYFDVMKAQAQLEIRQDIETAQGFIGDRKSVLDYSCFLDSSISVASGSSFSEDVQDNINDIVMEPAQAYLSANFPGGRTCGQMGSVWQNASCGGSFPLSVFQNDSDFAASDNRDMSCFGENATQRDITRAQEERAAEIEIAQAVADGTAGQSGNAEKVVTYIEQTENCGAPIPTGVPLMDRGGNKIGEEFICMAPGCSYDGQGTCRR